MKDNGNNMNKGDASGGRPYYPAKALGLARAMLKAGYGTRKQIEQMISAGRVTVNSKTTTDPTSMVKPDQTIALDGAPLTHQLPRYFMLHKPIGAVCTAGERTGHRLVASYLPRDIPGLAVVGRMDYRTSGLMLASNDRNWCRLLNGNANLQQEYRVRVQGPVDEAQIDVLTAGIILPRMGPFRPLQVSVADAAADRRTISIILGEGRGRHIRRVLGTLHHRVQSMARVRIGDVSLGDLKPGAFRQLTGKEVEHLRGMAKPES